jgi:hypothetical protein
VHERLIEYWLDSVNERSYQAAFLQMLAGEGHTILHSTRHMSIEFGKDVITIDSSGVPCAFQLKGNPGGRLTLSQFQQLMPQVTALVEQRIVYPGIPAIAHRCYLVTNGQIEEEVHRAVEDLNHGYESRGFHTNTRLQLVSRGTLLAWGIKHANNFWSSSFGIEESLIKFFNDDGKGAAPLELLSKGLDEILCLTEGDSLPATELARRKISASLYVAFSMKNYVSSKNHTAAAGAQAMLFAAIACADQKHLSAGLRKRSTALKIARDSFFSHVTDLAEELGKRASELEEARDHDDAIDYNVLFLQSGALADRIMWNARALKTCSLLSLLNIEFRREKNEGDFSSECRHAIDLLLRPGARNFNVWGEGAIPQLLAHAWNWRISAANFAPNLSEANILRVVLSDCLLGDRGYIASPYYSAEEAIRDLFADTLGLIPGQAKKGTQSKSSYTAEALFHCFVRSNLKSQAKSIWPNLTRIFHKSFIPENVSDFCLWKIDRWRNIDKQLEPTQTWRDVQIAASDISTPHVPDSLRSDPVMLLAFIIFVPHRTMPEVVRFLHYAICGTWFMPFPRP